MTRPLAILASLAFVTLTSLALAGETSPVAPTTPATAQDPPPYSARSIPAYAGKHDDVYRYIDKNIEPHLANLQRWVRQRSISAQNDGIRDMAEMLRKDLLALGFKEAELVPTTGHPGHAPFRFGCKCFHDGTLRRSEA